MSEKKKSILEWMHINKGAKTFVIESDFLGALTTVLLLITTTAILIIIVVALVKITIGVFYIEFIPTQSSGSDVSSVYRNLGLMIAALVGFPFIIWRAIAYQKQVNVAEIQIYKSNSA